MAEVVILVWVLLMFIAASGAALAAFGPSEPPRLRRDSRSPRVIYRVERPRGR